MLQSIKEKFEDLRLSGKITLANSILFLVVMLAIMLFYNYNMVTVTVGNTRENNRQKNDIVAQRVEQLLENTEDMSSLIVNNDNVQKRLLLENPIQRMLGEYTIGYILNTVVENSSGISTVVVYRADGGTVSSSRVNIYELDEEELQKQLEEMEPHWADIVWDDLHTSDYHLFRDERNVVTLQRNIISLYTGEIMGLLVININEANIAELYAADLDDHTDIVIINEENKIISARNKDLLFRDFAEAFSFRQADQDTAMVGGEEMLVTTNQIDEMGWKVVRMESLKAIYAENMGVRVTSILIAALAVGLAALATKRIADALTKPIMRLSSMMDSPDEVMLYGEIPDVAGNDEAGKLTQSFRRMQVRMQVLIERVRYEQQQHMKNEMMTLQTQINPHFLYNTLESVCSLIQLGRLEDASKMVKSIENFYRGTLSKGSAIITLKEEINVTMQYVQIQQYRYDGDLKVEVHIAPAVEHCLIPKLTLQPIIENAIYHGLKNGGRDGLITIDTKYDADTLMITVRDNGEGFDVAESAGSGYGLKNTISRIQSFAGPKYGIELSSVVGVGTTVYINLPNKKG